MPMACTVEVESQALLDPYSEHVKHNGYSREGKLALVFDAKLKSLQFCRFSFGLWRSR